MRLAVRRSKALEKDTRHKSQDKERQNGMKKAIFQVVSALTLAAVAVLAQADELNLRPGVTEISREVYDLHMDILGICVGIGLVVFGVLFWSVYAHRKSRGQEPAQFHHNTKLARDRLDRGANDHPCVDGDSRDPGASRYVRHRWRRHDSRSARLPMEVAIQVSG